MKKISATAFLVLGLFLSSSAQLHLEWIDTTTQTEFNPILFLPTGQRYFLKVAG